MSYVVWITCEPVATTDLLKNSLQISNKIYAFKSLQIIFYVN